jgi:hypothetical protein
MNSKWLLSLVASLIVFFSSEATVHATPRSKNCSLKKIPKSAVVLRTHGADLHIFPDAVSVDNSYSGCQNIWLENGHLLAQARYINGIIVTYSGNEPDSKKSFTCQYNNGKIYTDPTTREDCPPLDFFPINKNGRATRGT